MGAGSTDILRQVDTAGCQTDLYAGEYFQRPGLIVNGIKCGNEVKSLWGRGLIEIAQVDEHGKSGVEAALSGLIIARRWASSDRSNTL